MADDTSERIVTDEMEQEIFPAVAADPLGIARTHGTVNHRYHSPRKLTATGYPMAERFILYMSDPSTSDTEQRSPVEPPLWSIGLAAAVIVVAPMVMYSLAPAGPIREGDTVFSNGSHKVHLSDPNRYQDKGYVDTCLLDPKDPLIITHGPVDETEGLMAAQVQGKSRIEWPFCPPQAEILIRPHQFLQKPPLLQDIKDSIIRVFRG